MEGPGWGRGSEGRRQSEEVIFLGILTFSRAYFGLSAFGTVFEIIRIYDGCLFGYEVDFVMASLYVYDTIREGTYPDRTHHYIQ